jgi:hypothetical protein
MLVREVGSFSFHAIVRVAENGKDGRTRLSITVMNGDYHAISESAVDLLFEIWDVVLTLCVKDDKTSPRVHFAVRMFTHIVQCNQCRLLLLFLVISFQRTWGSPGTVLSAMKASVCKLRLEIDCTQVRLAPSLISRYVMRKNNIGDMSRLDMMSNVPSQRCCLS